MVTLIYLDILNNLLSTNLNALLTLFILVNRNFIGTITLSAKYKLFLKIFSFFYIIQGRLAGKTVNDHL